MFFSDLRLNPQLSKHGDAGDLRRHYAHCHVIVMDEGEIDGDAIFVVIFHSSEVAVTCFSPTCDFTDIHRYCLEFARYNRLLYVIASRSRSFCEARYDILTFMS